jgi:hypothetical protein
MALGSVTLALAACSSGGGATTGASQSSTPPSIQVPLDASLTTPAGTWVVVATGHLDQLANTFWQLFVLPSGKSRWSLVTPPGVADNGGLVSAPGPGSSLVTGFVPSEDLTFSPMATTSDDGKSWTPKIFNNTIPSGLVASPDALAASADGQVLVLSSTSPTSVISTNATFSVSHTLATETSLTNSAAGRACDVGQVSAVAFTPAGDPLIGATCSSPGRVGIFEQERGVWRLADPPLPPGLEGGRTEVVRLTPVDGGVSAIVAAATATKTVLVGLHLGVNGSWTPSPAFPLEPAETLSSSGTLPGGGVFVELSDGSAQRIEVLDAPGDPWVSLPAPPVTAAAVAFSGAGRVDAFSVDGSTVTDYTLDRAQKHWVRSQVIEVPIQYGSSS